MSILQHLCKLMALPPYIAVGEAKSKLQDTYLNINGELTYIEQISDTKILTLPENCGGDTKTLRDKDVSSIEFYLPTSGIYMIDGTPVHLWKIPKRQWRKSFSWSYYTTSHSSIDAHKLFRAKRMEIYRSGDNLIYYDILIGKFKDGAIIPIVNEFIPEIELYKGHVNAKV